MKKSLIFLAVTLLLLAGCSANKDNATGITTTKINITTTVKSKMANDFFKLLENNGYKIGKKLDKIPQIIGATDGASYSINGTNVEIYRFDKSQLNDTGKKNYDSAVNSGKIEVYEGIVGNVAVNGEFVIFTNDVEPKIIDLFKKW